MDKSDRLIIRMLLDGYYSGDRQKRKMIKLFTGRNISPISVEAFKEYILQYFI